MPRSRLALLFSICLWLAPVASLAGDRSEVLHERQSSDFVPRRAMQALVVLGDYAYLEGGRISWYIDHDEIVSGSGDARPINDTLSLPLSESWSIDSVEITSIKKRGDAPPPSDQVGLWADTDRNVIYRWGGARQRGYLADPDDTRLWMFTPDSQGSGEWSIQDPEDPDVFDGLVNTMDGGWTSCGGRGYWLGGYGNERSDARFASISEGLYPAIPGFLTYDMEARTWSNDSLFDIFPNYGTWMVGEAQCLPSIGERGVILTIGGMEPEPQPSNLPVNIDMRKVAFIDTADGSGHYQMVDGDVPDDRGHFCSVAARSTTGSYDIWIYGGEGRDTSRSDIWVLSLPAFRWFEIDVESPPRMYHNCALVGRRQALVTGGLDTKTYAFNTSEEWPHGLGIFDLTSLEWSTSYNANADDYESPQVVQDWYADGGLERVEWRTDAVRNLFANSMEPNDTSSAGDDTAPDPGSNNIGTIAGAVVGGMAGLALLGAGIYMWFRRSKRGNKTKELQGIGPASNRKAFKPSPYFDNEGNSPKFVELDNEPHLRHELSSASMRHEMPTQTSRPDPHE